MDEERMRLDHCFGLVLCYFFSALTLLVGLQEKLPGCLLEQAEEGKGNQLSHV